MYSNLTQNNKDGCARLFVQSSAVKFVTPRVWHSDVSLVSCIVLTPSQFTPQFVFLAVWRETGSNLNSYVPSDTPWNFPVLPVLLHFGQP